MAERKGDTKETLLDELESIKGLLQDDDEIPILSEVIESIEPVPTDRPRQPSLFNTSRATDTHAASPRPASITRASGENPFLPAHIRERLKGNRPPPLLDDPASEPSEEPSTLTRETLIQGIVQESLPELEARLRARLHSLTEEQLRALLQS